MFESVINDSEAWKVLPWKKFEKHLFRLQNRLFKVTKDGNVRKIKNLQRLIVLSQASHYLAVRQITQLNEGKRTAGVDGKSFLNEKERMELAKELKDNWGNWKPNKLKKFLIPNKNGKSKTLKVPTLRDRAWQCLIKYVIEPAHEVTFHSRSYGFRPGRSTHDAQKHLFQNLNSHANGIGKRILELEIEKCFDRINHSKIMQMVIVPQKIKLGIFRSLKIGVSPEFPNQGTPQGGVISPLLSNVVLNGIEDLHSSTRYADDIIFYLKPEDNEIEILEKVRKFLGNLGLNISAEKTKISKTTDGFDFLGWHIQNKVDGKIIMTPSEDNYKKQKEKILKHLKNPKLSVKSKVTRIAPIVRGWRNYHKYCFLRRSKFTLWNLEMQACKIFNTEKSNKYEAKANMEKAFPKVPYALGRFVNVAGNKSPFDGNMVYWSARNSKRYDGLTATMLRKQNHSCGNCNRKFTGTEKVELHHIDGNHNNWLFKNLKAVHQSCHKQIHSTKRIISLGISGAGCGESCTSGS
jgi:RNA-directed DNA polymerase